MNSRVDKGRDQLDKMLHISPVQRLYQHVRRKFINSAVLLSRIEEGRLLNPILITLALIITVSLALSGIDFNRDTVTTIYRSDNVKEYHVKKVSEIPEEKEKEEQQKLAVEEENLTKEEIIERYYQYVVNKIEMNKVYPPDEQRKGHEGSVILKIIISRGGKIEKAVILQQPRYMKLSRAAIKAIRDALPLKPYSRLIEEDMLVLRLEINFFLQ